ncbi:MAG: dienelactone hydrolase family protein [Hahellaceae bacterium]|nr:dienelactone hydrolase family protein [Hahellaceae bacterium]MCP5168290.1 dienelactone hydrolase family protein [Hahellaceae bacterium]
MVQSFHQIHIISTHLIETTGEHRELPAKTSLKPYSVSCSERKINVGTRSVSVEIYAPVTPAPTPGILLLHELMGLLECYREDATALAAKGYLVYLPDLFSGGAVKYCIRALIHEAGRRNRAGSAVNQEIHLLLDALKSDPACTGSLGMLGACLTGGFVLQMAKRPDMLAPVLYHHSVGIEGAGVPLDESLNEIQRLQGHWSENDIFCPASRRNQLKQALGDKLEAYVYNMPHGFRSWSRHLADSETVWQRTLAFFDQHLQTGTDDTSP